jgi:hypothetical protein
MSKEKITTIDKKLISQAVNCSVRQVNHIVNGKRGKFNTPLQQKIKEAIAIREKQNNELIALCNNVPVESVTPKAL